MKKTIFILAFTLILGACNKEKKFDILFDGTWLTTSMDGVPVTMADTPIQYKFSNSNKKGGAAIVTYFDNYNVDSEYSGTYKINDEGDTLTIDAKGINGSSSKPDIHTVDAISNQTDGKFTAQGNCEARKGFVCYYNFVFEKQ